MRTRTPLLVFTVLALAGCGKHDAASSGGAAPQTALKVGIIPFDKMATLQAAFQPFAGYLGTKAGRPGGTVFVTGNYSGILQALKNGQIDCAYLNPLSYVLAVQEYRNTPQHLIPLGMPYFHNSLTYKGVIYVRTDSGITDLPGLRGKAFAFGDRTSTTGYLYPAGMMKQAGIDPARDIKAVNIPSNAGVLLVFNKQAAGGATYETGLENAFTDTATKTVDQAKIAQMRVIATTDPIPNGMIVTRADLDPATLEKLKAALANNNTDAQGQAALKAIPNGGWNKIVPPDDKIFDRVRVKAQILGLKLSGLDAK